jgi:hypothetical protein
LKKGEAATTEIGGRGEQTAGEEDDREERGSRWRGTERELGRGERGRERIAEGWKDGDGGGREMVPR